MATCSCDNIVVPDCLDIPEGLFDLPRQSQGFGEFRQALIEAIGAHPELDGWSGEGEQDLGVMLLEMWAYVLDITQLYDARITEEFYLTPAKRRLSADRLIKLLGYRPRPALSAEVTLAAEADGIAPLTLPEGTAFRSEAFDDEPPQVFSLLANQDIDPARNNWRFRPIPGTTFPGRLLFSPRDGGVPKTGVLAFRVNGDDDHAGTVSAVEAVTGPDDQRYQEVTLEQGLSKLAGKPVSEIQTRLMGLSAGPTQFGNVIDEDTLILDGVYPQLRAGDIAVLEVLGLYFPFILQTQSTWTRDVVVGQTPAVPEADPAITAKDITAPASIIELPAISGVNLGTNPNYRVHFHPIRVGRLVALEKTELGRADITAGAELEPEGRPVPGQVSGGFMITGTAPEGATFNAQVVTDEVTRKTTLVPGTGNADFPFDLIAPLSVKGNLVNAVRGEKVTGEVLGSGNAGEALNRFKLENNPLSWVTDEAGYDGIRPLLEVRMNGVLWEYVPTLYTAKPGERVFALETDAENITFVLFGNGLKGARPDTGVGNITATYYHGAGIAKPPPGAINQIAKPFKGLRNIINPIPALGGRDPESIEDLKTNAPAAALTLGRAVSVQDFEALARTYPGVINVASGWAWDTRRQRATVSIWVIGTVDAKALEVWLRAQAAEDLPVRVVPAAPVLLALTLSIDVDPAHPSDETREAVKMALVDPETGFLAAAHITIGGTFFRSQLVKIAQTVTGVAAVTSVRIGGSEMDWARRFEVGTYPDFYNVEVL